MNPHSLIGRMAGAIMGLAPGLFGFGAAPAAQVQDAPPSAPPVEWVRYAEAVTIAVTGWLEEENETANRLRTYLDATRPAPDQPTPPLALKIWIDPDGRVSRIDFTAFANEQASMDLRATITGRTLPSAPPKDMLLPIRAGRAASSCGGYERCPGCRRDGRHKHGRAPNESLRACRRDSAGMMKVPSLSV